MRPLRTSVFITVNRAESPHLVPLPWKCHSGSEHLDPSISILSPFLASRPFMIIPPKCFPVSSPVLQPKGTTHSSPRHTLAHISHFHLCTLSSFLLHVSPFLPLCCPPLPRLLRRAPFLQRLLNFLRLAGHSTDLSHKAIGEFSRSNADTQHPQCFYR